MIISYQIGSVPEKDGAVYTLPSYTEGAIDVISTDGAPLFHLEGVLLVEMAIVLKKWLAKDEEGNSALDYWSMDFEEGPVLALVFNTVAQKYEVSSHWSSGRSFLADVSTARQSAMVYLKELEAELLNFDWDLKKFFKE